MGRYRGLFLAAIVIVLTVPTAAPALAQGQARPWHLSGSNELLVDNYDVSGNEAASRYRFTGTFWSNRLRFQVTHDAGRGRVFKVDFGLLAGKDDYLDLDVAELEILHLSYEDGTRALPYRLEAGDMFTNFSRRVLQTSVRGVTFELQPQTATGQSIVVVSGSGEPGWDNTFDGESGSLYYNGVSYLLTGARGRQTVVANFVNARRTTIPAGQPSGDDGSESRTETSVGSVYGETWLGDFFLEGEVAYLSGTAADEAIDGSSYYAQLSRSGGPLSWRVRFENNGQDYRPVGSTGVIPDRRIGEFHGRYALGRAGTVRGRLQLIENEVNGAAPVRTNAFGLSYDGRPLRARTTMHFQLAGDLNDIEANDGSRDVTFKSLSADVDDRLAGLSVAYRLAYRDNRDNVVALASGTTVDNGFDVGRPLVARIGGGMVRVNVRGGVIFRSQTGGSPFHRWSPTIDVALDSARHHFGLSWSFLSQDFAAATVSDLKYRTQRIVYAFEHARHRLSLEVDHELRLPELAERTDSLRLRAGYRYTFDRAW